MFVTEDGGKTVQNAFGGGGSQIGLTPTITPWPSTPPTRMHLLKATTADFTKLRPRPHLAPLQQIPVTQFYRGIGGQRPAVL